MTDKSSSPSDKRGESTDERLLGLFTVTGIAPSTVWTLPNQYWPDSEHYAEVRRKNPWLLVKTQWGLIQIGWRKRVIEIDWSDTAIRGEVTADDVTKSTVLVHAWSYEKAVEYLIAWRKLAETTLSHALQKCRYCANDATQTLIWLKDKQGKPARVSLPWCGCDLMEALRKIWPNPYRVVEGVDYETVAFPSTTPQKPDAWDIRGWWATAQECGGQVSHEDGWTLIATKDLLALTAPSLEEPKRSVASATPRSEEIPLCSGHAESWFCGRDHLPGDLDCVVCAFVNLRRPDGGKQS